MKVYIVYEGDKWLSSDSLRVDGVYTSWEQAAYDIVNRGEFERNYKLALKSLGFSDDEIPEMELASRGMLNTEVYEQLKRINQTQGFDTNFMIEERKLNEWD